MSGRRILHDHSIISKVVRMLPNEQLNIAHAEHSSEHFIRITSPWRVWISCAIQNILKKRIYTTSRWRTSMLRRENSQSKFLIVNGIAIVRESEDMLDWFYCNVADTHQRGVRTNNQLREVPLPINILLNKFNYFNPFCPKTLSWKFDKIWKIL